MFGRINDGIAKVQEAERALMNEFIAEKKESEYLKDADALLQRKDVDGFKKELGKAKNFIETREKRLTARLFQSLGQIKIGHKDMDELESYLISRHKELGDYRQTIIDTEVNLSAYNTMLAKAMQLEKTNVGYLRALEAAIQKLFS